MEATLKYAEHKLDESIRQDETDVDIAYWRGYRDCAKVMERDHFRDSAKMMPLTMEQLRKMDGMPVWIKYTHAPDWNGWSVIKRFTKEEIEFIDGSVELAKDYEKIWISYAYPPANIDRDAYKPCMMCKNQKSLNLSLDMNCRYCPKCGRPLTEDALAELENRLRG